MGPAGISKTEVVRQVAEEQGLAFLSYSVTPHAPERHRPSAPERMRGGQGGRSPLRNTP